MRKNKEDNVVFVLQKALTYFKVKITKTSIKEYLLGHPHYPSLKSVCDALQKWKIEHYPLNLETDEIKTLEIPFIAHLNSSGGQLVFVEKIDNGKVIYFLKNRKGTTEEFEIFKEKLSGAVVVMEVMKNSGEKEYSQNRQNEILNKSMLPLSVLSILLLAIISYSYNLPNAVLPNGLIFWGLLCTKSIGLTASILLVLHEFKVQNPIGDKICGFNSKMDCDIVLSSGASKLFGWINWTDVGLIFFSGSLIYLMGTPASNSIGLLAVISLFTLPYPFFSIYYQSVRLKKWCPFCLIVQTLLIIEFTLLLPVFNNSIVISFFDTLKLITYFTVTTSLWLILKALYNRLEKLSKEHSSLMLFKRNSEIFFHLLKNNEYFEFKENKNSLILGTPGAKITITAFLSLYCSPCTKAFSELTKLLDNYKDIKINVIFKLYDDVESKQLTNTLYSLYKNKGSYDTIKFINKWYSMPKKFRKTILDKDMIRDEKIKQISEENKKLFKEYIITGTPTIFLNGYKFPKQFEYSDTEYYIDEIKKSAWGKHRKEAYTNIN